MKKNSAEAGILLGGNGGCLHLEILVPAGADASLSLTGRVAAPRPPQLQCTQAAAAAARVAPQGVRLGYRLGGRSPAAAPSHSRSDIPL
jgi:hypothetical protein